MKFKFLEIKNIKKLPKNPGIYAFKRGRIFLYIGKATNIRERVKNHFQQRGYKDYLFLDKVKKIGYIKTNSEIEALILEANLIKKYQPKYNVIWKDNKNYFYVAITKKDFPRIFITHQPQKIRMSKHEIRNKFEIPMSQCSKRVWDLGFEKLGFVSDLGFRISDFEYVGPFVDGKAIKETLKALRKVFPYRSCKTLPKRACLWYHLGRCPAPCLLKSKILEVPEIREKLKREIQRNVKSLFEIIKGKKSQVLKNLKKEMKGASIAQDFERAAKIRDQILALERVLAHAKIFEFQPSPETNWLKIQKTFQEILKIKRKISRIEAYDVSNIQGREATGSMIIFINGETNKNFYRRFKIRIAGKPNDIAMIKECLKRRFGHPEWGFPDLILVDGGRAQLNVARNVINQYRAVKSVSISVLALAKKENELFIESQKEPILLKALPREIFNLILQLRDEAHRFAISYHRKLRLKGLAP